MPLQVAKPPTAAQKAVSSMLGRIVATGADLVSGLRSAAPGAVARERLAGVIGAARVEAAGARQKRAHAPLVRPYHAKEQTSAHATLSVAKMPRSRTIMWGDGLTP